MKIFGKQLSARRNMQGLVMAVFAVILFSTNIPLSKLLLGSLDPYFLAAVTAVLSSMALLTVFGAIPEIKKLKKLKRKTFCYLLILSISTGVIAPIFLLVGLTDTSAVNAVLLRTFEPVSTGILSIIFLKEKPSITKFLGLLLMLLGIYIVASKMFMLEVNFKGGDFFILLSGVMFAIGNVVFKKHLHKLSTDLVVLFRNFVSAVGLSLILLYLGSQSSDYTVLLNEETLVYLALLTIFVLILGQFLWFGALEKSNAYQVSGIALTKPLFGVLLANIILGNVIQRFHVVGGALIVVGLVLTLLQKRKHTHRQKHLKVHHFHH